MGDEKLEKIIQSISNWTKIPVEEVRKQREISRDYAIERFLSNESKEILLKAGYKKDRQTYDEKLRSAFALIGNLGRMKDDFYKTPEGKLWYDCNIPNMAQVACYADDLTRKFKRKMRASGQGRQISIREAVRILSYYRG